MAFDYLFTRMANLHANIAQVSSEEGLATCLDLITASSVRLMRVPDDGIRPGAPADRVVLDASSPEGAVAALAQPLFGLKGGRRTVEGPPVRLPC